VKVIFTQHRVARKDPPTKPFLSAHGLIAPYARGVCDHGGLQRAPAKTVCFTSGLLALVAFATLQISLMSIAATAAVVLTKAEE